MSKDQACSHTRLMMYIQCRYYYTLRRQCCLESVYTHTLVDVHVCHYCAAVYVHRNIPPHNAPECPGRADSDLPWAPGTFQEWQD